MVITGLLFCAMTASVKSLGTSLPASQSGFIRYIFGLFLLVPFCRQLGFNGIRKSLLRLMILRGSLHAIAVVAWFYAMVRIPMTEVTALYYLVPVFVFIGASFYLKERINVGRILCLVVALLGTFLILRPGVREVGLGHLTMLLATVVFGISFLLAKKATDEVKPLLIVFMLTLIVSLWLAPLAFIQWEPPSFRELSVLMLVALFATCAHLTMSMAFKAAPVTVTQPIVFFDLVWAAIVGLVFFSEAIDIWVIIGGLIIVTAVSLVSWIEIRKKNLNQ
jgi:drug/metabolite transporter (DMT)-like permease